MFCFLRMAFGYEKIHSYNYPLQYDEEKKSLNRYFDYFFITLNFFFDCPGHAREGVRSSASAYVLAKIQL